MKRLKPIAKWTGRISLVLLLTLGIFELLFRFYLIDFYALELKALNRDAGLARTQEKTLLVFGDSFSADPTSYVGQLQDSLEGWNVINCAISGISAKQMRVFFADRIEQFQPDELLIQLYVGNDFQDYRHIRNWSQLPFMRNLYWAVSDCFISLQFLNYRMGSVFRQTPGSDPKDAPGFDAQTYNHRERLYFQADPLSLYQAIQVSGKQEAIFADMLADLEAFADQYSGNITLLILPHASQTSAVYQQHMERLGANFPQVISQGPFPFFERIQAHFQDRPHIQVCTPLERFRTLQEPLYFQNDPHLSPLGQQRLYEFVQEQLPQRELPQ